MKNYVCLFMIGALSFGLATGCAKKKESFSYDLEEDACPTGKHMFSKKMDYCRALKDDEANNNCAFKARTVQYNKDCGAEDKTNATL